MARNYVTKVFAQFLKRNREGIQKCLLYILSGVVVALISLYLQSKYFNPQTEFIKESPEQTPSQIFDISPSTIYEHPPVVSEPLSPNPLASPEQKAQSVRADDHNTQVPPEAPLQAISSENISVDVKIDGANTAPVVIGNFGNDPQIKINNINVSYESPNYPLPKKE